MLHALLGRGFVWAGVSIAVLALVCAGYQVGPYLALAITCRARFVTITCTLWLCLGCFVCASGLDDTSFSPLLSFHHCLLVRLAALDSFAAAGYDELYVPWGTGARAFIGLVSRTVLGCV